MSGQSPLIFSQIAISGFVDIMAGHASLPIGQEGVPGEGGIYRDGYAQLFIIRVIIGTPYITAGTVHAAPRGGSTH